MFKKSLLFMLSLMFSSQVLAVYTCGGYVEGVSIDPKHGAVFVEKLGVLEWQKLCLVTVEHNGISPESCKLIYSTLLTAQIAKKSVTLWFNDGKDCSSVSHPPWSSLSGWYFGPKLGS